MTKRRRIIYLGLYDAKRNLWARSGGRVLSFWGADRARAARDQWNNAGAHLGACWQVKALPHI
jgi:hypothetical protein